MQLILIIIGIMAVLFFIAKFVAILMIPLLNKGKTVDDEDAIICLTCSKSLFTNSYDVYLLPTISISTSAKKYLNIEVSWIVWHYEIVYYYKTDDF